MRVIVFVKATPESESGAPPTPELIEAMGKFNQELHEAGILLMAEGLKPTAHAKRVAFNGATRTVTDGPFTETHEIVAGFWLWDVKDMNEAVAWVQRCPNPMTTPSDIDIRPIFSEAEFEAMLPEHLIPIRRDRIAREQADHASRQTP